MLQEDIYIQSDLVTFEFTQLCIPHAVDCPTNTNTAETKTCKMTISRIGS